jgi:hypothetical protein
MVQVEGLVELNKALKDLGDEFKGEMRRTNKGVADFVATDARAGASAAGSTLAHIAPSIKASAGALSAGVSLGGPAYPMAAGAEFGAGPDLPQFKPWRGNGQGAGYAVYPAIRANADRIESEYGEAADRLIKKAGLA